MATNLVLGLPVPNIASAPHTLYNSCRVAGKCGKLYSPWHMEQLKKTFPEKIFTTIAIASLCVNKLDTIISNQNGSQW